MSFDIQARWRADGMGDECEDGSYIAIRIEDRGGVSHQKITQLQAIDLRNDLNRILALFADDHTMPDSVIEYHLELEAKGKRDAWEEDILVGVVIAVIGVLTVVIGFFGGFE